jgi:hypothetical protein
MDVFDLRWGLPDVLLAGWAWMARAIAITITVD